MRLVLTNEHRFEMTPDGSVWTRSMLPYTFWTPYLSEFKSVRVVARVQGAESARPDWARADGEGVTFSPVPNYLGPWQYLRKARLVRRAAKAAVGPRDAVIMRVPSIFPPILVPGFLRSGRPFGLEVVGDPCDVYAPGAVRHPLRPLFRRFFSRRMRGQIGHACAVHYVTHEKLQRRYPPGPGAFSTSYSDAQMRDEAYVASPRPLKSPGSRFALVTVGSLAQMYKGPDILLAAVAICVQSGLDVDVTIIGDGRHRPELEAKAASMGLVERARFLGQLPAGTAVRAELDRADLFVLPSRVEGLPRAMIEAMARALPCVGSTAGGIPELLPEAEMVPPGDAAALAAKLNEVLKDPARLALMSARNLEEAREYHVDKIRAKRLAFYAHVRESTEAWLDGYRQRPCPTRG